MTILIALSLALAPAAPFPPAIAGEQRRYCVKPLDVPNTRYSVASLVTDEAHEPLEYQAVFGGQNSLEIKWVSKKLFINLSDKPSNLELPDIRLEKVTKFPVTVSAALDGKKIFENVYARHNEDVTVIPDRDINPNAKPYDLLGIKIKMSGDDLNGFFGAEKLSVEVKDLDQKIVKTISMPLPDWKIAETALKEGMANLEISRLAKKCYLPSPPVV